MPDEYQKRFEVAKDKLTEIVKRHDCQCGEASVLDVIICPHQLDPVAVVVYCPCNGTRGQCPPCLTFRYLDSVWDEV